MQWSDLAPFVCIGTKVKIPFVVKSPLLTMKIMQFLFLFVCTGVGTQVLLLPDSLSCICICGYLQKFP